jgi:Flp pilus assembly secretin CpaC
MDIPILGNLFSSTRWQRNETELVIVVTPMVVDPMRPRAQDAIRLQPDTTLPAREVIQPRLVAPTAPAPSVPPRRP